MVTVFPPRAIYLVFLSFNPFTTAVNPFLGTKLLEFSIGKESGALKALSTSGRKLEDRLMFNLTPEWSLYFRPNKYPDVLGKAACTSGARTAFSLGGNMGGNIVTITTYNSSLVRATSSNPDTTLDNQFIRVVGTSFGAFKYHD